MTTRHLRRALSAPAEQPRSDSLPKQLLKYQNERKAATVALVAAAIKHLQQAGRSISLANIREVAMTLPDGRRMSEKTIVENPGARELYIAAARARPAHRVARVDWFLKGANVAETDLPAALALIRKLRAKSKSELVRLGWDNSRHIEKLEAELKQLRATKLDAIVPASVKVLRPLSRR